LLIGAPQLRQLRPATPFNAMLAAVGYNFRLLLRWLRLLLSVILGAQTAPLRLHID
jgi:hypothetical protein